MEGSPTTAELYSAILMLSERVDYGFTEVARRFDGNDQRFVGIDQRLGQVDQRIAQMDYRLNTRIDDLGERLRAEMKVGFDAVDTRLTALESWTVRADTHFERIEVRLSVVERP
ncbi:MAG TPA: hypothetical protein VIN40_06170 [Candidatus Tyrphobacter sp.]